MAAPRPSRVPKEFLGAFKQGHRESVREYIDDDLAYELLDKVLKNNDQAAREQLAYLTKFNNEYYKAVVKKGDKNALHNTPEMYKSVNDAHNARRRDVLSVRDKDRVPMETPKDSAGKVADGGQDVSVSWEAFEQKNYDKNHEDNVIELLDNKYNKTKK